MTRCEGSDDLRCAVSDSPAGQGPSAAEVVRGFSADPEFRLLMAEDNVVNQLVAQAILARAGYQVDIVGDGRAAVDAVTVGGYDVVLMDVRMPRLDGREATREIRSLADEVNQPYVIALTATATASDRRECLDAGMDAYINKPVRVEELEAALGLARSVRASGRWRQSGRSRPEIKSGSIALDLERFAALEELGTDLRTDVVERWIGQCTELLAEMSKLDTTLIAFLAHRLCGSSAAIGAVDLAAIMVEVENTAIAGHLFSENIMGRLDEAARTAIEAVRARA